VFRAWLDVQYIPTKFSAYLEGKVKKKALDPALAAQLVAAVAPAALPQPAAPAPLPAPPKGPRP
jgi:hypothetical protein